MSKKLLFILLLVSLAFNLAVLGSFVYLRFVLKPDFPPPPPHHVRQGKPGPHELKIWQRLEPDENIKSMRREFMASKRELMQELAKENLDESRVREILDASLKNQTELETRLGDRLIQLRKTMSAEEAKEFFGKRMDHPMGPGMDFHKRPDRHRRKK